MQIDPVKLGDEVFYIHRFISGKYPFYDYKVVRDFIVKAKIVEINEYFHDGEQAYWHYRFEDGSTRTIKGGNVYEGVEEVESPVGKMTYRDFWLDCYTGGHAVQLHEHDRCFLTLSEAKRCAFPTRRKHIKRLLKSRYAFNPFPMRVWVVRP